MQIKSIAECFTWSILQYFRPSLSYHLSLRSLFCQFLSGCFTQVLLHVLSDTYQDGTLRYGSLLVRIAELVQCRLQHKLAIGLLLSSNPNLKVPQLFEELIVESECE